MLISQTAVGLQQNSAHRGLSSVSVGRILHLRASNTTESLNHFVQFLFSSACKWRRLYAVKDHVIILNLLRQSRVISLFKVYKLNFTCKVFFDIQCNIFTGFRV